MYFSVKLTYFKESQIYGALVELFFVLFTHMVFHGSVKVTIFFSNVPQKKKKKTTLPS